jgi:hypothetical protein
MSNPITHLTPCDAVDTLATSDPTAPVSQADAPPDPFALDQLRLSPQLHAALSVQKLLTHVPVRKPAPEWFIRVHGDPSFHLQTYLLELKEDNELYLVAAKLWNSLVHENGFARRALFTAQNRQGDTFLWPIRLPDAEGRLDPWSRSALAAAQVAKQQWVRVRSKRSLGAYEIYAAAASWGEPAWPEVPFQELLKIAFQDWLINRPDHPVLKRLRGEA